MHTCVCALSCPIICEAIDVARPLSSSVHGIFQVIILEWVAISYSRAFSWPRDWTCISCVFCTSKWILYHCAMNTLGSLFSRAVGREGCCKQILLACACSVSSTLGLPLLAVHTAQALCSSTGELSEAGPWLHAPPLSKPLRLGAQEALRGADLVGPAFCALPRSE